MMVIQEYCVNIYNGPFSCRLLPSPADVDVRDKC